MTDACTLRTRLAPALALGLALALSAAARAQELNLEEACALEARLVRAAEDATAKTVCVYGVIGLGSGAVVDADGTVVTNAHVAAGAQFAVILRSDGERLLYRLRGIDFEKDLAVLAPERPLAAPVAHFEIARDTPPEGSWVAALGYPGGPRGADPRPTFTIGRVRRRGGSSTVAGVLDYAGAIRTDVPIFSGNSGGPLVDLEGRLVGINGAVDLTGDTAGLSIPTDLVLDRIETLTGGVIRLPGGIVLDPRENRLVRLLEEWLGPVVRERMERQLHGRPAPEPDEALARDLPDTGDPGAANRFAARLLDTGRNRLLKAAFAGAVRGGGRALALALGDDRTAAATPISRTEAVASLGALGDEGGREGAVVGDAAGRCLRVAARAPAHDLALLVLESGPALEPPPIAERAPAVGTLVVATGKDGPIAAGVVSAPARRIDARTSLGLAQAAAGGTERRILQAVSRIARAVGASEVVELIRRIEASLEIRRGFSAGSHPRGHARVISHDLPLGPAAAGAPLLDLGGRLVGVHVATAHHGTSYAVPIETVREALGAARAAADRAPAAARPARREF